MFTITRATRSHRTWVDRWHLPSRQFASSHYVELRKAGEGDPRLGYQENCIQGEYAHIGDHYATPKFPIVLAHGLLGFAELHLTPGWLPPVRYWRGIAEALKANGVHVITTTVPPAGSIEQRAEKLARGIAEAAGSRHVNIIAHSMGGLDVRYLISHLRPADVVVRSLVTVASPHHGSSFADFLFQEIGNERLPELYRFAARVGLETGAFEQLTTTYMTNDFNPRTPDDPGVRYFSYGAMIDRPPLLSPFRHSHGVISRIEGPNDGLVSVASSQWGSYKGTLGGVSHLDLINWTNRWRWMLRSLVGETPGYVSRVPFSLKRCSYGCSFNAIAFYLSITDMLAKEGF
ncbi:Alpha/Beta hydrolase protein [Xylaria intraflava]|nr:Alpha/Beta hydrolase protein [Xylaria intraflava]